MLKVRIAICEDEQLCRAETVKMIKKWLQLHPDLEGIITAFENGQVLVDALKYGEQFDLYLLDVLMPKLNGIQTGAALRRLEETGEIIYLTSTPDFAVDSYGVGAFFYLVKPIDETKLFGVLDNAIRKFELRRGASIIVPTERGECRLLLDDILYAEKTGRRMQYVCISETIYGPALRTSFRETVKSLLDDERFCLCGASFAINLGRVRVVNGQNVCFTGNVKLTLPRTACTEFKRLWGNYWLKETKR